MAKYIAPPKIFDVSKLFQHGKTQVPRDVRRYLNVEDGDKLVWYIEGSKIFVKKAE